MIDEYDNINLKALYLKRYYINLVHLLKKKIKINDAEISRRTEKVRELKSSLKSANANQKEHVRRNIEEQEREIDRLER